MPNYLKDLEKRYKYERKADKAMRIYIKISDDLYSKHVGGYASVTKMDIDEDGITYEYWVDYYDFSKGRDYFFISKEKIEGLVEEYKRKERKEKLNQIENYESNR